MRHCFRLSTSALALLIGFGGLGHAHAREADPVVRAAEPAESPATGANQLDEIVITALRQKQDLLKTSAAVTFIGADVLKAQQVTDIRGLQNLLPSARISPNNTATRIFIRGAGSPIDFYWVPETVAINFNGVYEPRFATVGAFFDLDNIQVLPGPQGVLYGRSAGGGVVLVNTRRPTQERQTELTAEYGSYDLVRLEGVQNLPLTDNLAARVGINYLKHDGYESLGAQAQDSIGGRVSLLWTPAEHSSIFLWANAYKDTGTPAITVRLPYLKPSDPWFVPATDPSGGSNLGSSLNYRYTMLGGELDQQLGAINLHYVASYLNQREHSLTKVVGFDQTNIFSQKQYTQDLRFSNDSESTVSWIAGASWFRADAHHQLYFGSSFGSLFPVVKQLSKSGFAQVTVKPQPSLRLIGGARYSVDSLKADGSAIICFGPCQYPPITFDRTWRHTDWKASAEYDLASDVMIYGTVQTGYVPGTFNTFLNVLGLNKEVLPQELMSYTAGVKTRLGRGLATLNAEAFDYRYKNFIIQTLNPVVHQAALFNAPHAHVYGLQVDATLRPTSHDTLAATMVYTHGRYGAFQPAPGAVQVDGFQMQYTPDLAGTVSWNHRFDLPGGARVDMHAASYLTSSFWGAYDHVGDSRQKAYSKTDLSLTYHPRSDNWHAGVWVKNLEDRAVWTAISTLEPDGGLAFVEPPREVGVSFGVSL